MKKFVYPTHPARCIMTRPSSSGKSFLTNSLLKFTKEDDEIYTNSPNLHQHLYQKQLNFSVFIYQFT